MEVFFNSRNESVNSQGKSLVNQLDVGYHGLGRHVAALKIVAVDWFYWGHNDSNCYCHNAVPEKLKRHQVFS